MEKIDLNNLEFNRVYIYSNGNDNGFLVKLQTSKSEDLIIINRGYSCYYMAIASTPYDFTEDIIVSDISNGNIHIKETFYIVDPSIEEWFNYRLEGLLTKDYSKERYSYKDFLNNIYYKAPTKYSINTPVRVLLSDSEFKDQVVNIYGTYKDYYLIEYNDKDGNKTKLGIKEKLLQNT